MKFKRCIGNRDYKAFQFFGGANIGGVRLGISPPRLTSSEAKKRIRANGFNIPRNESIDGKVKWELTFKNYEFPGVFFTVYDYKGYLSCGFGMANNLYKYITQFYADKLNAALADLVNTITEVRPPEVK